MLSHRPLAIRLGQALVGGDGLEPPTRCGVKQMLYQLS